MANDSIKIIFNFAGGVMMTKFDIFDVILLVSMNITGLKTIGDICFDYLTQNSLSLPDGNGHVVLFFKGDRKTHINETYETFFVNKNLHRIEWVTQATQPGKLILSRKKVDGVLDIAFDAVKEIASKLILMERGSFSEENESDSPRAGT